MPAGGDDSETPRRPRRERTLRARALAHLARREHGRVELERRLSRYAESPQQLRQLLDDLVAEGLLSDRRFAEALARSRGGRFGAARLAQELRARGVNDAQARAAVDELRRTEMQRARALWQRRFGSPPADAGARARQMRFLAGRGFDADVIRRVIGGETDD
jgi:regulatory protein